MSRTSTPFAADACEGDMAQPLEMIIDRSLQLTFPGRDGPSAADCEPPEALFTIDWVEGSGQVLSVRRSEAFANFRTPVRRLSEMVRDGRLAEVLSGPVRHESKQRELARQRRLSPAEIDCLAAEYSAGGKNVRQLAAKWGVSRNIVAKHLRSRGLELGPQPLTHAEIFQARRFASTGMSLNAIGRKIGRDPKTVKAALAGTHSD